MSSFIAHNTIFILDFPAFKTVEILMFPTIDLSCNSLLLLASLEVYIILTIKEGLIHYFLLDIKYVYIELVLTIVCEMSHSTFVCIYNYIF